MSHPYVLKKTNLNGSLNEEFNSLRNWKDVYDWHSFKQPYFSRQQIMILLLKYKKEAEKIGVEKINQLPRELRYQKITPRGFPCIFKEWEIDPVATNKTMSTNDIVRFNFMNNSTGVFDPYRSYIEITVSVNETDNPIGLLQVDNSAQSFIQHSVLFSNSREIERIVEYGVLAAYLNDMGLNEVISEGREEEGLGYGSFDTMPFSSVGGSNLVARKVGFNQAFNAANGLNIPTQQNAFINSTGIATSTRFAASRCVKGHVTDLNVLICPHEPSDITETEYSGNLHQSAFKQNGYHQNIRSEYATSFKKNNFIESTSSIPCYSLDLDSHVFIEGGYKVTDTVYTPPKNEHGTILYTTTPKSVIKQTFLATGTTNEQTITTSNFGFANLFSPAFSRGTFEPFISTTVRQAMLFNGKILQTKEPLYRRKFKIPLISGLIGILIEPSQYTLLPLKSLNNCLLELNLDPYAMFTSGYKDICEFDTGGILLQQPRKWSVDRIQYKMHTYHFPQNEINEYIDTSLYKEINFISNFWSLGTQVQIPANQGPNNSYQVGCTSKNLNQLVCLFNSNDYQNYTFCRKHYRLSNNVTRFQMKLGVDYFPYQPHKGQGGNAVSNDMDNDNSKYVENLYFASNYMFSTSSPLPRINIYNFALNERPYDPTNRNTLYSQQVKNNPNIVFTEETVNSDTAMGMCWIHENRAVGKSAYLLTFSPYSEEDNLLRGIDVSGVSNLEVMFESESEHAFPRAQTLYVYCRSSVFVSLTQNGIEVFGR